MSKINFLLRALHLEQGVPALGTLFLVWGPLKIMSLMLTMRKYEIQYKW